MCNHKKLIVRFYLIEGFSFSSRDSGGMSDPYVIVSSGNKKYGSRDEY